MVTKKNQSHCGPKTQAARHRSQTPTTQKEVVPSLLLKLKLKRDVPEQLKSRSPPPPIAQDPDSGVGAKPALLMTRHGRQVRRPQHLDNIYGNELDELVKETISQKTKRGKTPDERASLPRENSLDLYQHVRGRRIDLSVADASSPQLQSADNINHLKRRDSFNPSLQSIQEDGGEVLDWNALASRQSENQPDISTLDIHADTQKIFDTLLASSATLVDLPSLSDPSTPEDEQPYTAKTLVHLYLLCHEAKFWNGCDLIADTWIRAFHEIRLNRELGCDNTKEKQMQWRPNSALERKKRDLEEHNRIMRRLGKPTIKGVGFDAYPPRYNLVIADPMLTDDVTEYDASLLDALYAHTPRDCGARLLWADAMALCGDATGELIKSGSQKRTKKQQQQQKWHPDLLFDIMQTALRMTRRKLTLKIEESTEGAWCQRYHEHGKHGMPCYKEIAWREESEVE